MKTKNTNSAPFVYFFIIILLSIWANNSFGQGQTIENLPTETFYCFKYDDLSEGECYPTTVSVQDLEDNEFQRKIEYFGRILPYGIGLPSMEDIRRNLTKEIFDYVESHLVHPEYDGHWADYLTHLIKDDTKGNNTAHLIKFEGDDDTAYLILIHPDWDGANKS